MLNTPKPPAGLKTLGKQVWSRAFSNSDITEKDYDAVFLLAKLSDERKKYEDYLRKNNDIVLINNDTNIILHPYLKRISEIDKQIFLLLKELALTPNSRVDKDSQAAANPLTGLMNRYHSGE